MTPRPEPPPAGTPDAAAIQRAVRRTVGIAALRRIRRLVDAEEAAAKANAHLARVLGLVLGAGALAVVAWIALH